MIANKEKGARKGAQAARSRRGRLKRAAAGVACLVAAGAATASELDDPVAMTRTSLEEWVEIRKVISKEKRDWVEGRELLTDSIDIIRGKIASMRKDIEASQTKSTEADAKIEDLVAEQRRLKEASESLVAAIAGFEDRTKALLARVPEPIREQVKPLSLSIPEDPNDTKLSLSQRYQNVVGILNAINKFNGEVKVSSELRTLDDGSSASVTAMYIGIGQGYYVSSNGDAAGVGRSGPEGWVWETANEAAPEIQEAIAIQQGETPAHFVRLPIRIE